MIEPKNILKAHDVLRDKGFVRCEWDDNSPAVHYHLERPPGFPSHSAFRDELVVIDLEDVGFEELETVRLYSKKDTL